LCEHASELDITVAGGASVLTLTAHRFFLHHRYSGGVHFHIQNRDRLAHHDRQIQLLGPLNLLSRARADILSNGFCRSLHGFGSHLQIGQQFHLLATPIEGGVLAHHCLHAAHPRGELRVLDIQFDIRRKLAVMAVRAQVVGSRHLHLAYGGEDRLGAQFLVTSMVAASASQGALAGRWGWKLQQLGQGCGPGLMHG
jgi:hypothetical protein